MASTQLCIPIYLSIYTERKGGGEGSHPPTKSATNPASQPPTQPASHPPVVHHGEVLLPARRRRGVNCTAEAARGRVNVPLTVCTTTRTRHTHTTRDTQNSVNLSMPDFRLEIIPETRPKSNLLPPTCRNIKANNSNACRCYLK